MKRWIGAALLVLPLAFGVAGCNKAHKAGNDSMSTTGGRIGAAAPSPAPGGTPQRYALHR